MTNAFYGRGSSIIPFVLADARDLQTEFAAIEQAFDAVELALTENRLASTSTTTLSVSSGSKTLLIETGRAFAVGQFVSIARTDAPTTYMSGQVTAYNATTGVMVVNVTDPVGTGSFNEWTVALTLPGSTSGFLRRTGDTMSGPLALAGDPATDNEAARKAYVDLVASAAQILAKLLTVDGSGSALDADMLDGLHAAAFAQLAGANFTGNVNVVGSGSAYAGLNTAGDITANRGDNTGAYYFTNSGTRYLFFNGAGFDLVGGQLAINSSITWNAGNDGAGSGLDADLLDGLDSTAFVRTSGGTLTGGVFRFGNVENASMATRPNDETPLTAYGIGTGPAIMTFHRPGAHAAFFGIDTDNRLKYGGWSVGGAFEVWRADNDGSGSGLDADLLDGLDSTAFVRTNGSSTITGPLRISYTNVLHHPSGNARTLIYRNDGANYYLLISDPSTTPSETWNALRPLMVNLTSGQIVSMNGQSFGGGFDVSTYARFNGNDFWHAGNDGSGSGLDADLLDGLDSTAFARLSQPVASANLADAVGYKGLPINLQNSTNYTLALSDIGKCVFYQGTTSTITIPAGVFPDGAAISIINDSGVSRSVAPGAGATLLMAGTGASGTRTISANGWATLVKAPGSDKWYIGGTGVS